MKLYLIYIILLSSIVFSQQKENHFTYSVESNFKSFKKISKVHSIMNLESKPIDFEYFEYDEYAEFKPVVRITNSQGTLVEMNQIFKNTIGQFFYYKNQEFYINQKEALGKTFLIKKTKHDFTWHDTNKIDTINTIPCKKYVYTKIDKNSKGKEFEYKITAWTDETYHKNISPFGLIGLKGLIMKIDFNNHYIAKLQNKLISKNKAKIKKFKSSNLISEKDFDKIMQEYLINRRKNRYRINN